MRGFGVTDKGCVRKENQDGFLFKLFPEREMAFFAVCDGMGGARAGRLASQIGLETFFAFALERLEQDAREQDHAELLVQAAAAANLKIYERSLSESEARGMGTTLVSALITRGEATVANIGDSRAYHLFENSIQRITRDHSFVEEMVLSGQLTREQARVHPKKNYITRALGVEREVLCDIFSCRINAGELLLLCTDGLSNLFPDEKILEMAKGKKGPQSICKALLKTALKNGAPDNVTITVFEG